MRVLHITSVIDGRKNSGTARVAREIIMGLNNKTTVHQEFLHFDSSSDPIYSLPRIKDSLVKPLHIPWGGRFLSFLFFAICKRIRIIFGHSIRYDVVHWHTHRIYPFFFLLPSKKHIITIHDAGGYLLPKYTTFSTRVFQMVLELHQKRIFRILLVSKNAQRELQNLQKFSPEKLDYFYPGSNFESLIPKEPNNFQENIGVTPFFVCVSRWQPHKNVESSIYGFARFLEETNLNYKLVLVGKPVGLYTAPRELITSLKLEDAVWIIQDLSDQELKFLYQKAQVNLFLSVHEGFGLSVLEGMTCGCPAIVSKNTATYEVIGPGGVGVDVNNSSEIIEAIFEIINKKVYRGQALEQSRKFNWVSAVEKIMRIYS